jgi:hypothetical protein
MTASPRRSGGKDAFSSFSTFLRNELCSNNLADFGIKHGDPARCSIADAGDVPRP